MNNSEKIILDLCGGTGAWSKPYKDAGYDVRVITLPYYDVRGYKPPKEVYGILAAPPCTMFSMARTVAKTPRDLYGAMQTVQHCLRIIWECQYGGKRLRFWAMENPKARLRWFLGLPAMTFSPNDYGDAYRKPTDLWGNFNTDLKKIPVELNPEQKKQSQLNVQPLLLIPTNYVRDLKMSPRAIARSITHPGFANAFFKANP
jgi:hypothetical protein